MGSLCRLEASEWQRVYLVQGTLLRKGRQRSSPQLLLTCSYAVVPIPSTAASAKRHITADSTNHVREPVDRGWNNAWLLDDVAGKRKKRANSETTRGFGLHHY